jgi:hypothetical protein
MPSFLASSLGDVEMQARRPLLEWLPLANTLLRLGALKADCEIHPPRCVSKSNFDNRNLAPVAGGERDLRTSYLKPFNRACIDSLSIMTAYSSYGGIPAIANTRKP